MALNKSSAAVSNILREIEHGARVQTFPDARAVFVSATRDKRYPLWSTGGIKELLGHGVGNLAIGRPVNK